MGTPKPPEVLQAQVAAYAQTRQLQGDSRFLTENAAQLADGPIADVTRTVDEPEALPGSSGVIERGTVREAGSGQEYVAFLRAVGGMANEGVRTRAQLLDNYEEFRPHVAAFMSDSPPVAEREGYLGKGINSVGFEIHEGGEAFVVRMSKRTDRRLDVEGYLSGALRAIGIPHLEQVVAISYEDAATVAQKMPGQDLDSATPEQLRHITDPQLEDLLDTIAAAYEAGIVIDSHPSNYFYDVREGFGIIDLYHPRDGQSGQNIGTMVALTIQAMGGQKIFGYNATTIEQFSALADTIEVLIPVLERYGQICRRRYEGATLEYIETYMAGRLAYLREDLVNFRDDAWVAAQGASRQD